MNRAAPLLLAAATLAALPACSVFDPSPRTAYTPRSPFPYGHRHYAPRDAGFDVPLANTPRNSAPLFTLIPATTPIPSLGAAARAALAQHQADARFTRVLGLTRPGLPDGFAISNHLAHDRVDDPIQVREYAPVYDAAHAYTYADRGRGQRLGTLTGWTRHRPLLDPHRGRNHNHRQDHQHPAPSAPPPSRPQAQPPTPSTPPPAASPTPRDRHHTRTAPDGAGDEGFTRVRQ